MRSGVIIVFLPGLDFGHLKQKNCTLDVQYTRGSFHPLQIYREQERAAEQVALPVGNNIGGIGPNAEFGNKVDKGKKQF